MEISMTLKDFSRNENFEISRSPRIGLGYPKRL